MDRATKRRRIAQAPILTLAGDVLELVLGAAFGGSSNERVLFLQTSKVTYGDPELWGTQVFIVPGHPPPEEWLREHKSVKSVVLGYSQMLRPAAMSTKDLAVLRGSGVTMLDISKSFAVDYPSQKLWDQLAGLPLTYLDITHAMAFGQSSLNSLGGLKDALPELKNLACMIKDGSELAYLRGLNITHLSLATSSRLESLAGIECLPLESLDLRWCASLRDLWPLRNMKLSSLNLSFGYGLAVGHFPGLEELPLVNLSISGVEDIHIPKIVALAATLRHLRMGLSGLTDTGLFALGSSGMRLETLGLIGCESITAAGIGHLATMSSSLKHLNLFGTGIQTEDCPPELAHCIRHWRH
jgi:hypothetical protein